MTSPQTSVAPRKGEGPLRSPLKLRGRERWWWEYFLKNVDRIFVGPAHGLALAMLAQDAALNEEGKLSRPDRKDFLVRLAGFGLTPAGSKKLVRRGVGGSVGADNGRGTYAEFD